MTSPEDTATFASGEKARQVLFDEIDKVLDRVKSVKKKITRTELPIAMPMSSFVRENNQDEFGPALTPIAKQQTIDADFIPPPTPIQFDHFLGISSQDCDDGGLSAPLDNVNIGTPIMSTPTTTASNTTSDPVAKIVPIAVTLSKRRKEKSRKDAGENTIRSSQVIPPVMEGKEPDKGIVTACDDDSCSDCSKSNTDVGPTVLLPTDDGFLTESVDDGTLQTLETDSTDTPAASALTEVSKSKSKIESPFNDVSKKKQQQQDMAEQKAEPSPLSQSQQQRQQPLQPRSYSHALQHTPPSLSARRILTSAAARTPPPSASTTTAIAAATTVAATSTNMQPSRQRSSLFTEVDSTRIVSLPAVGGGPSSDINSSSSSANSTNSSENEDHAGTVDPQSASASATSSAPSTLQIPVVVGRKRKTQSQIPKPASISSDPHNPTVSSSSSSTSTSSSAAAAAAEGIAFPSPVRTSSAQVLMDVLLGSNQSAAMTGSASGTAYEYNSPLRSAAGNDRKGSSNNNNNNNNNNSTSRDVGFDGKRQRDGSSNGVSVMTYSPQKGAKSMEKLPVLRAVSFSLNSLDDDDDAQVSASAADPNMDSMSSSDNSDTEQSGGNVIMCGGDIAMQQQQANSTRAHGNGSGTSKNSNSSAANNSTNHSKPNGKGSHGNGGGKAQPLPSKRAVPPSSGSGGYDGIDDLNDHATASSKKSKSKKSSSNSWLVVVGQALLLLVLSSAGLLFAGVGGPRPGAWLAQLYLGDAFYPVTAAELRALSVSPPTTPQQVSRSAAAERWRSQSAHHSTNGDYFEGSASSNNDNDDDDNDDADESFVNGEQDGRRRLSRIEVELKALANIGLFSKAQGGDDDTSLETAVDEATKSDIEQSADVSLARYDDYLAALTTTTQPDHTLAEESAPALAEVVVAMVPSVSPELLMTMSLPVQGRATLSGEVAWEFSGHLLSDLYHRRSSMRIVLDVCFDGRKLQFPTGDRVDIGVADGRSIKLLFRLEEHGLLPGVHEIAVRAVFIVPLPDSDAAVAADRAETRIGKDCFGMGFRRCRAHVLPESIVQFYYVPLEHPRYQQEIEEFRAVVEGRRLRYDKAAAPPLDDSRKSGQSSPSSATTTAVISDEVPASITSGVSASSPTADSDFSSNPDNHRGTSYARGHQGGQGHLFAAKGLAILSPEAEMRLTMPADVQGRSNTGSAPLAVVQLAISLPRRLCLTTGGVGKWSLRSGTLRLQIEHNLVVEESGGGSGTGGESSKLVYDTTQIALEHFDKAETLPEENAAFATTTYSGDSRDAADTTGNFVVIIDMQGLTIGTHAITAAIVVVEQPTGVSGVTPLDGNTVLYSDAVRFFIHE